MVKIKPEELEEELNKQEDEVYGTAYVDGDPKMFADTEDMLEDVIGNKPDDDEDGFLLSEEIDKDEADIAKGAPDDSEQDELESEMDKIERKEKYKEDSSED